MNATLTLLCTSVLLFVTPIKTEFTQVAPTCREEPEFLRSLGRDRAVVLIHGLYAHMFSSENVLRPRLHSWQQAGSKLINALGQDADVYSFAYSQNASVERIAESARLERNIRRLKQMGYTQIVIIGHSAGGLIARQLVEDQPDIGVTKVVQVCTPNGGCSLAKLSIGVRAVQEEFLSSLTKENRKLCLDRRRKQIPEGVEFVCIVGLINVVARVEFDKEVAAGLTLRLAVETKRGDGLVACARQWSPDLQEQGIPAVLLETGHFWVMRTRSGAEAIARVVRATQPRWDEQRVAEARRTILGE